MNMRRLHGGVKVFIVPVILVVAGTYFFMQARGNSPVAKFREQQHDPESSVKLYAQTGYQFIHMEHDVAFEEVSWTVTKDDFQWFKDNYSSLHVDTFNLAGGIDPNSSEAIAKRSVLGGLLQGGVCGNIETTKKEEAGDTAVVTAKWTIEGTPVSSDVTVVKEDGVWKVKSFAGARDMAEGKPGPRSHARMKSAADENMAATSMTQAKAATKPDVTVPVATTATAAQAPASATQAPVPPAAGQVSLGTLGGSALPAGAASTPSPVVAGGEEEAAPAPAAATSAPAQVAPDAAGLAAFGKIQAPKIVRPAPAGGQ